MTAKDINGNEIKVGDTVERVTYLPHCEVKAGETYLVESISEASYIPCLRLDNTIGSYYANRFKVIKKTDLHQIRPQRWNGCYLS